MTKLPSFAAVVLAAAATTALAQEPQPSPTPPPAAVVHSAAPASPGPDAQLTNAGALAVSQVKLANGTRASKVIGSAVYNDNNEKVGSVDEIILGPDNKAMIAVIQVGGFLGAGGKLVAIPFEQLHMDDPNKVVLGGASKDALTAMPTFTYGG